MFKNGIIHILREKCARWEDNAQSSILHILREKYARWEVNAQSSILNNETLDVKPLLLRN